MKSFVLLSVLTAVFISPASYAFDADSPIGGALGVPAGIYHGSGTLESRSTFVPDVEFESDRQIEGGLITAHTSASLLGIEVAEAHARLKVVSTNGGRFELLDLDSNEKPCGVGYCDSEGCSFTAKVMNGDLVLNETWIADEDGFTVMNGSQIFRGKSATYEGRFQLADY